MGPAGGESEQPAGPGPVFTELSARRLGPVRRFLARRPRVLDGLVALGFTAWAGLVGLGADSMYVLSAYLGGERVAHMQQVLGVLIVAGAATLLWRRSRPVAVAVAMGVLGVAALAVTGTTSGFELGLALALYSVATSASPRVTWATLAVTVGGLLAGARVLELPSTVGAIMLGVGPADPAGVEALTRQASAAGFLQSAVWYRAAAPVLVLALLAVAVGTSARNRRQHLAAFVEAANALARDQEQRAAIVKAAERARIAREMHDVVAHSISVMIALGGGARAAVDWAPERSRAALDDLVATGRAALGDVRRVLGVLHDEDDDARPRSAGPGSGGPGSAGPGSGGPGPARPGPARPGPAGPGLARPGGVGPGEVPPDRSSAGGEGAFEPQPGAGDLATLVERFRSAGLPVRTTGLADAALPSLGANVQLAVYRVVQESLTNVLRHAPGTASVEVGVHAGPADVEVVVTDQGPTAPVGTSPGSGRGVVGMRERVAAFGGSVEAGPYGRGWRVRALVPTREDDA